MILPEKFYAQKCYAFFILNCQHFSSRSLHADVELFGVFNQLYLHANTPENDVSYLASRIQELLIT